MNDQVINTIIGNSPTIAALIMFIYLLIKDRSREQRERLQKENKQDNLEKEFRKYLMDTQDVLIKIVHENSIALNRNAKAYEVFSHTFEEHIKNRLK